MKQFAIFYDFDVECNCGVWRDVLCWIYHVWSSKECVYCACDPSVHIDVLSIGVACICVCLKLSPHLRD